MTKEEKAVLNVLLEKMATESEGPGEGEPRGRPAGFVPEVCLGSFYKSTCTPFLELIIYRERAGRFEYLYQDRHDEWWDGFCAFGGMVRAKFPATPPEIAQKLLDREFRGLGITLRTLRVVSFLNWPVHPWCNPVAVVCLIQVNGEILEGDDRHWLSVDNLPERMVINHGEYLRQCEHFLRHGALVFTPSEPYGEGFLPPPPEKLYHVVLISFKESTPEPVREDVFNRYQTLADDCGGKGAGILSFTVKKNLDPRKNVHLVEIATFTGNEALQAFRAHPEHKKITDILRDVADWQVGDIMG